MLTVVLFSAHNCSYCPAVKRTINELKTDYEDCCANFATIELGPEGQNAHLFQEWGVNGVPAIIIIDTESSNVVQEKARLVGTDNLSKDTIIYTIESFKNE